MNKVEDPKFEDRLIRMEELKTIFGVCERTIRRKSDDGELPPLKYLGRTPVMLASQVKAYFQKLGAAEGI